MRITPVTRWLLLALGAGFGLQLLLGIRFEFALALWPLGPHQVGRVGSELVTVGFQPWQVVTYSFLHSTSNLAHLLFNGFALYSFGPHIERLFGAKRYVIYWFGSVVGAAAAQLATVALLTPGQVFPTVGASGGVFGLLLAYGLFYPRARLMLMFIPIPAPAWVTVIAYGIVELVLGFTGTQPGVAHFAHLGGLAAGFLLILFWELRARLRPPTGGGSST